MLEIQAPAINGQKEYRPTRNSEGIYKIMDGLYISGIEGAKDYMTLQRERVTHILNMVGPSVYDHPLSGGREKSYFPQLFKYKIVTADDNPEQDLLRYFPETSLFIHEGRMSGGILVHCYAGVSRSASAIMAYMIDTLKLDAATAFDVLKRGRPQAYPNVGFQKQIKQYAAMHVGGAHMQMPHMQMPSTSAARVPMPGAANEMFARNSMIFQQGASQMPGMPDMSMPGVPHGIASLAMKMKGMSPATGTQGMTPISLSPSPGLPNMNGVGLQNMNAIFHSNMGGIDTTGVGGMMSPRMSGMMGFTGMNGMGGVGGGIPGGMETTGVGGMMSPRMSGMGFTGNGMSGMGGEMPAAGGRADMNRLFGPPSLGEVLTKDLQSSMRGSLSQFGVMSPLFPSMGSNSGANMRVSLEHFGNQGMGGMQGMGNVMSGVGGASGVPGMGGGMLSVGGMMGGVGYVGMGMGGGSNRGMGTGGVDGMPGMGGMSMGRLSPTMSGMGMGGIGGFGGSMPGVGDMSGGGGYLGSPSHHSFGRNL